MTQEANYKILVGPAGNLQRLAEAAFAEEKPRFYDWFSTCRDPAGGARSWVTACGWNEQAWAFLQLRYDQVFKQSVIDGRRHGLGALLFDIGWIAQAMGHTSAVRHYSALAVIGDILDGNAFDGAAVPTLANVTSRRRPSMLQESVRKAIEARALPAEAPLHPEAFLAAPWFGKRGDAVLDLARPIKGQAFVERLLDHLASSGTTMNTTDVGTVFEAAAGLVLSTTPGFEVRSTVNDAASQTDLLLSHRTTVFGNAFLPEGYAVLECKYTEKVGAPVIRDIGARCMIQGVKLAVLATREGIKGDPNARNPLLSAELERRRFLPQGIHILVVSEEDIRGAARDLRGVEAVLRDDFERLRFGEPPPPT
ncbi:MAG: hypothetical protein ABSF69_28985 [Polyangiaceae bacterium]|jgi:hypothetical protein